MTSVYVVDDDDAVRDALAMLIRSAGLAVEAFPSARAFLDDAHPAGPCCLILDIRMPGMSGTELQDRLIERGAQIPIIFIAGHGDIPTAVQAMRKGAYDFLEKPFDDHELLRAVRGALDSSGRREPRQRVDEHRLAELSAREREVLDRVLEGKPGRQIAQELAISLKTVEFHRANVMHKLGARSAAQLFRLCLGR